jgi:alpha-1,3/alpha-1,6-mannosyltransferase
LTWCFYIIYASKGYDIFLVDQMANSLPLMRLLFPNMIILFYCHYPDKLLSKPGGTLKRMYRVPMDAWEEWALSFADEIFVNSKYTMKIFREHFKNLYTKKALIHGNNTSPCVLYPGIITKNYHMIETERKKVLSIYHPYIRLDDNRPIILSLNRFERKKDIKLVLSGYHFYRTKNTNFVPCLLIIAGGYDPRVSENVEYHHELEEMAGGFGLGYKTIWPPSISIKENESGKLEHSDSKVDVLFLPSISSDVRNALLHSVDFVLYTPSNEHFGLVPVEAMACGKAIVMAMKSGGPVESILDRKTGFLMNPTSNSVGNTLSELLEYRISTPDKLAQISLAAKRRVLDMFTMDHFIENLIAKMETLLNSRTKRNCSSRS